MATQNTARRSKTCPICGKEFYRIPCYSRRQTYCSYTCSGVARSQRGGLYDPNWRDGKVCLVCRKRFFVRAAGELNGRKYCSPACWGIAHKECNGPNHPRWKGGIDLSLGYELHLVPGEHRYIAEHRRVMEEHLCRPLRPDELVHHKDGDKLNNSLENLQLVSRSEHVKLHPKKDANNVLCLPTRG